MFGVGPKIYVRPGLQKLLGNRDGGVVRLAPVLPHKVAGDAMQWRVAKIVPYIRIYAQREQSFHQRAAPELRGAMQWGHAFFASVTLARIRSMGQKKLGQLNFVVHCGFTHGRSKAIWIGRVDLSPVGQQKLRYLVLSLFNS
jgi:hypothetical protein